MELIIHVGLPKTATTTIQESLTKDTSINFINKAAAKYLRIINNASEEKFHKKESYLKKQFYSLLKENKLNIISYESFTDVITPLFINDRNPHRIKMLRLYKIFGEYDPKIIITIRNQVDLFYSSFVQGISEGWHQDVDYSVTLNNLLDKKKSVYDLNRIVYLYKNKFRSVAVIGFETVYHGLYFQKLSDEFNVPIENVFKNIKKKKVDSVLSNKVLLSQYFKLKSLSLYNNIFLRLAFRFLEKITRNISLINLNIRKPVKIQKISKTDREKILEEFKEGNYELINHIEDEIVSKYYLP